MRHLAHLYFFVSLVSGCQPDTPPRAIARQMLGPHHLARGPDAIGGLGDWYLANDLVEAIIDDVNNQNHLAPTGGTLIDFAIKGMHNDQLPQVYQIFMLSQSLPIAYREITATSDFDAAQIDVKGFVYVDSAEAPITAAVGKNITVETSYALRKGDPALYVTTTLRNDNAQALTGIATVWDVWLWGNRSAQPFAPFRGRGFAQPTLDVNNPLTNLGAYLYVGARGALDPGVSYGAVAPSLPEGLLYGINTQQLSALGPSPLTVLPVAPGKAISFKRQFLIGQSHSIEAVADQAWRILHRDAPSVVPALGHLAGRVLGLADGRGAEVVAQVPATPAALAKPLNAATVDPRNRGFYLTVPVGTYELVVQSGNAPSQLVGPFTVGPGDIVPVPDVVINALAIVDFAIVSDALPQPARLTFKGVGATPDPQLGTPYTGMASNNVIYSVTGAGRIMLEPGTYDVYASRGLEYTIGHRVVTLAANELVDLQFELFQVLDTTGWISGDFHVHSMASLDSSLDLDSRVAGFAGEGVRVLIATDHDFVSDLEPIVKRLGLSEQVVAIKGSESTSFVPAPAAGLPAGIGHNNSWPLLQNDTLPRQGAVADEGIEPAVLYERLRARSSALPVIQLNHPRASYIGNVGLGYFTNFKFDPRKPVPRDAGGSANNFLRRQSLQGHDNLSFDAMEVINGCGLDNLLFSLSSRADWLALMKQGIIRTGTANSDSHTTWPDPAGFPRNYVRYSPARLRDFPVSQFNDAILHQHSIGTNGPWIDARIGSAGPGDTTSFPTATTVPLDLTISAAPWIPVDEVRVLVNGAVVCTITTQGATGPLASACPGAIEPNPVDPFGRLGVERYQATVTLPMQKDSFVIVEAGVNLPAGADLDDDGSPDTWDCDANGTIDARDVTLCAQLRAASPAARAANPLLNAPALVEHIVPGMLPWAFINPIFVHFGVASDPWVAPGL